ncbi:unnamed protein product [Angiostrongylus costaricensis]|uniref:G_PROTEIN_RECEP_F1_2 domain-containing protein n=1 Tax=Angiostrongylus costaricensis TaxID=334426 RepID=A0A0R3PE57_ANGCS|nr:unnamed protein product [Angiostrongylus costaricensis]
MDLNMLSIFLAICWLYKILVLWKVVHRISYLVNVQYFANKKRNFENNKPIIHRINNQSILRIRRIVTVFVVVYLACWTPYWFLFCFLSVVQILHRWMVVVSAFTHLLPYIACTAYPIILTAMNKEIHNAHSSIIDSKKRQLSSIRHGALQDPLPSWYHTSRMVANLPLIHKGGDCL